MNNRLQVGGLALVINSKYEQNIGRVVLLIEDVGLRTSPHSGKTQYYWRVKHGDKTAMGKNILGEVGTSDVTLSSEHCLMPLGDKQTQDELAKEKELENV